MRLRSLKIKFIFYGIPLILFVSLSFLFFFINRFNSFIKEELTNFGFHLARDLSYAAELAVAAEDPVLLQPPFEGTFKEEDVISVTVYNKKGNIIAAKEKVDIEEKIPIDVMEELLSKGELLKRSYYTSQGEEIYNFYAPIFSTHTTEKRELIGFVGLGLSLEKIRVQSREVFILGLSITTLIVFSGIFILIFLAGNLIRPLNLLTKGAETIAKGNLDYRIQIKTGDEIEQLAQEFNRMTESLEKSRDELERAKTILEEKVKERTKELRELAESLDKQVKEKTKELQESKEELEKRVKELERFQQITIGRELKMVELKKEVKRLKREGEKEKKSG